MCEAAPTSLNWLYRTETLQCGCGEWDNDPRTPFSRTFMPMLFVSAAVAILSVRKEGEDQEVPCEDGVSDAVAEETGTPAEDAPKAKPKRERLYHLDYARIACVACTVTEHSGGEHFSHHNYFWVQQWVVPFLYLVSGVSFMLSRSRLCSYEFRLFIVFMVGSLANWGAFVIAGTDWVQQVANIPFQMGYVLVLMVLVALLNPLKKALVWRAENPTAPATTHLRLLTALWGILALLPFVFYVGGWSHIEVFNLHSLVPAANGNALQSLILETPLFLSRTFGFFFLSFLAACAGKTGWATWILLLVSYAGHVFVPFSKGGHPLGTDLFVVGMVAFQWPPKFKKQIAAVIRQYWMLLLIVLLLLSNPSVTGRCDLNPLNTTWERLRYRAVEFALVSMMVTDALNSYDAHGVTRWMNAWALYAYCFHVAWARILPRPYGAALTYGCIPLFYLLFYVLDARKRQRKSEI